VSFFFKNQWQEWAREWGLTHYPEKGWMYRTEHVIGKRDRLLIRIGWGNDRNPGLIACIRFPRSLNLEQVRQALIADAALDALPGKGSARRKMVIEAGPKKVIRLSQRPEFILTDTCLTWHRKFAFSAPKAPKVRAWVEALVAAVGRTTSGFDGRCESCSSGVAKDFVVVDELPVWMCSTCVQRLKSEAEMADRTYDMTEARHVSGAMMACMAAIAGAVAWAALAAFTGRIFVAAAIGIGVLVALAYRRGAGRVDGLGRAIAAFLTVISVILGEITLYAWWFAKERPDIGFNLQAGWYVYLGTWVKEPGSEAITLLFGLLGAWYATRALQRPKLHAKIESAEPGVDRKAA
jgi:hypothetical protein